MLNRALYITDMWRYSLLFWMEQVILQTVCLMLWLAFLFFFCLLHILLFWDIFRPCECFVSLEGRLGCCHVYCWKCGSWSYTIQCRVRPRGVSCQPESLTVLFQYQTKQLPFRHKEHFNMFGLKYWVNIEFWFHMGHKQLPPCWKSCIWPIHKVCTRRPQGPKYIFYY